MQTTALLAALGSALGFALSTSLQHHAAGAAPDSVRGAARLLRHLLGRPWWLVGQVLAFVSFCLHAVALHLGALALVQPVVVSGIVLAVPMRAALTRERPATGEVAAVLVAAVGLGAFLVAAGTVSGEPGSTGGTTGLFAAAGASAAAALYVLAGRARSVPLRAGLYGVVAGVLFGLVAGLVKLSLQRWSDDGVVGLATTWSFWTLMVLGLSGVAINQQAYRAGALSASMPVLNVVNVIVALAFGVVVFQEVPAHTPAALLVQTFALGCIAVGLAWLSPHAESRSARTGTAVHRIVD